MQVLQQIHNLELPRPFVKDFDTICSPANVLMVLTLVKL